MENLRWPLFDVTRLSPRSVPIAVLSVFDNLSNEKVTLKSARCDSTDYVL